MRNLLIFIFIFNSTMGHPCAFWLKKRNGFNYDEYQAIKKEIMSEPAYQLTEHSSAYEILAHFEIQTTTIGINPNPTSLKKLKNFYKDINKALEEKTEYSFYKLADEFYLSVKQGPQNLWERVYPHKKVIREHIQEVIYKKNLEEAALDLGFINKGNMLTQFKRYRQKHEYLESVVVSTALNSLAYYWFGLLGSLPQMRTMLLKKPSQELINEVMTNGLEATMPKLKKFYGVTAKVDASIHLASKGATVLLTGYTMFLAYQVYPMIINGFNLEVTEPTEEEILKWSQEKQIDHEELVNLAFVHWMDTEIISKNIEATPEQIDSKFEELRALTDEELKNLTL